MNEIANIVNIKGVRCYVDKDNVAQLNLEDVARGLGFTQTQTKNGKEYTSIRWETINRYCSSFGFPNNLGKDDFIPEPIFYLLAMKADNETARAFQHTIAYEVLPDIRRYGFYGTPAAIDAILGDPDFGIRLLSEYKSEKERNAALMTENAAQRQVIADYEPKVQYLDKILGSKGTLTIKQIAADYDMTAQQLNRILHEERVQYKVNDQWLLYKEHIGMGYTKSKSIPIVRSNGSSDFTLHTQWTQKGRLFIHELLKQRGIMAAIDRDMAQ